MDRGTMRELEALLEGFHKALDEIDRAPDDAARIAGWRRVQTLGWRLHEVLPSAAESLPA